MNETSANEHVGDQPQESAVREVSDACSDMTVVAFDALREMFAKYLSLVETEGRVATMEEVQIAYLVGVLTRNGDNYTKTAKELGIARSTLYLWMNKYRIVRAPGSNRPGRRKKEV